MRRIIFDEVTIAQMREFAETHTMMEFCNRYTISPDVAKRVARDYEFSFVKTRQSAKHPLSDVSVQIIRNLYETTDSSISDICKESHTRHDRVIEYIEENYSEQYRNDRSRRIHAKSKLGSNNPMFGKFREANPNYKGLIEDGDGYIMCLKPDWYTGRKGSRHVFMHSVVMCEALGITEIPKGFVVHHIDRNKHNNDISNLALMSISAHSRLHQIENKMSKMQRSEKIRRDESPETPDND